MRRILVVEDSPVLPSNCPVLNIEDLDGFRQQEGVRTGGWGWATVSDNRLATIVSFVF